MCRVSIFIITILAFVMLSSFPADAAGFGDNPAFLNGKIKELSSGDIEIAGASGTLRIKKARHTAGHLYRFGELFEQQGDSRMAKKYYRLCLKKDPDHHMAKVKLGMEKMTAEEKEAERKKEEERRKLNEPDRRGAEKSGDSPGKASKQDLSKYKEGAVKHYRAAGSAYYRALKVAKGGATNQDIMELLDKAIREYQEALKMEPKFHDARHDLCGVCKERGIFRSGREKAYKLGLKEAGKYLKSNKKDVEMMHLAAFFAAKLGKVAKAESWLKKGLKVKPHDPELVLALSACYLAERISKGHYGVDKARAKKAVKLLEETLAKHPEHLAMRKTLARALIYAKMPEEARKVYRGILDMSKDDPDAYFGLGKLSYQEGKFDEAIQYLEKALAAKPDHHHALSQITLVYRSKKDMEKEAHYIELYLKHHPKGQNVRLFKKRLDALKKKLEKKKK